MNFLCNKQWLVFENSTQAFQAQKEMAEKVSLQDAIPTSLRFIGGMDVSNTPFDPRQLVFGAMVVCDYPLLTVQETATHVAQQTIPYIPGLLGFREVPALVEAYKKITIEPDIILVDGHGVSHPRCLGVASHIGVLLDKPTIGVAKSLLIGKPVGLLEEEVGSMIPVVWKGKEIAMMVRTKKRCTPLIISPGHKISLRTATQIVLACIKKHKLPEPTRYAHLAANICRKA